MAPDAPGFEFKLIAEPDSVRIVRRAVRALLRDADVDQARAADIILAVTEVCTNAVLHAYPRKDGVFHAGAHLTAGGVVVVVNDHGSGIGQGGQHSHLGVGLPLSAALADELRIDTLAELGTEVRISFDFHERRDVTRRGGFPAGRSAPC